MTTAIRLRAPQAGQPIPRRRAEDQPQLPELDLAPGEFRYEPITPETHSISLGVSGHEHAIGSGLDVERGTITCVVCEAALQEAAKKRDPRCFTVEISAETFFDLKQAARGQSVERYASELLTRPEKR